MRRILEKNIFSLFLFWYIWYVPISILRGWKNFLKFGLNYFSIPRLVKTLFSPWRKYAWAYPRGFSFWQYFESLISNLIFRILGAILRSVLIVVGIISELFIIVIGFLVFLGWIILPILLIFGLYHGFRILF